MADKDSNQQEFTPYVSSSEPQKEITLRAIILGALISIIFGVGNAYIGLRYGMTVSASLPAAVISMAILRGIFSRASVLENNMVQTIGSAGESLAAGVIFTFPAFLIWEAHNTMGINEIFHLGGLEVVALSLLGGAMGIFLMIPLRRYLVEKEHGKLKFPEGTACAEIIVAGDKGGTRAKTVFWGIGFGAVYKALMAGGLLWNEFPTKDLKFKPMDGGVIGLDSTPALLGVGYIIGPRIAALMLAGAVLGYLGIAPLAKFIGLDYLLSKGPAGMIPDEVTNAFIRNHIIKYLGVGAVSIGGFVSLIKSFPTIIQSFATGFRQIVKRGSKEQQEVHRTQKDLPMSTVLIGTLLVIIALWVYPGTNINILAIALTVVFGFFFIVVAARIVGIVGSSSSPVSGMTIATLLVTSLVLASFGIAGAVGMVTAMTVGAVVCISVCLSGDIAQDLKTGYLLGATPRKMQMMEFVGLAASALTMGLVLFLLVDTYGIVPSAEHPEPLLAPQANVMAAVVQGILGGELPWEFIIAGGMIALAVEFLGVSSLPFAIGLYLPLDLSTPIMCGGLLALMVRKTTKDLGRYKIREQKGVLFGSGIVAGDALIGVGVALLLYMSDKIAFFAPYKTFVEEHQAASYFGAPWGDILSLSAFGILMIIFWRFTRHNKGEI
jgi:putative OPT family oligopeptide transporter